MLGPIDIVMWSYRPDQETLSRCLESIERSIPEKEVCHRIAVIPYWDVMANQEPYWPFLDYHWQIEYSQRPSIPEQANIALSKVHTAVFASFEQDVIITPEWFEKQAKVMESDRNIAVAQGVRLFRGSKILEAMDSFKATQKKIPRWFYSLDNNLYRTEIIRKNGGFPGECPIAVDGLLREKLLIAGYEWRTDLECVSTHVHKSFKRYLETMIRRVANQKVYFETYIGDRNSAILFLVSPLVGLRTFRTTRVPESIIGPIMLRYSKAVAMLLAMRRKTIKGKIGLDVRAQRL